LPDDVYGQQQRCSQWASQWITCLFENGEHNESLQIVELMCGTKIRFYYASQILALTVQHEVVDILPQDFDVETKKFTFQTNLVLNVSERRAHMTGRQFPLISNSATTGHKLQGCTLPELAVFEQYYGPNWMYVVLLRMRTMSGLYLSEPLSTDPGKYDMSNEMQDMIAGFCDRIVIEEYTEEQYTSNIS
jgi:hypothetical protein